MDLVADANILFAALVKNGLTAELLLKNGLRLYAPEFILEEFELYKNVLKQKTGRDEEEFSLFLQVLQRKIILVPQEEIDPYLENAITISPDVKDIAYIALALRLHCAIWSNDKALKEKQNVITIYHTHDLAKLIP